VKSSALVTQSGADIGSGGAIWKSVTPLQKDYQKRRWRNHGASRVAGSGSVRWRAQA